ncbi:NAD-dependent epimerase/dehydratase family protein [Pseudoalteromonas sp. Z9A5]|uniref:NAD-dependent epimerase/dehydratase family protein n=1 Tax=Pseudoalteromonas sp. Z9A5 TaxID=2686355 RepID=UPI00140ABB7E|nr:NAD-dependent epimerase/dehydratase family protein [Pseudoalteromonas sp. Z9A5]
MDKVLVTGASGFVGQFLSNDKRAQKFYFLSQKSSQNSNWYKTKDFSAENDINFNVSLNKISVVIHLAAVAHKYDVNEDYIHKVNHKAALGLAKQAADAGVRRFIYLSTVSVYGNQAHIDINVELNPIDYSSKVRVDVENELIKLGSNTGMEIVIIRSPLIYGKGAPGNFGTLLKIAEKNLPLPLGAINNKRSYVALDNVIDLLITCIEHPNAANQTFLASDDENISTSNLLKKLTLAAGKKPWLLPVPVSLLKLIASIIGKKAAVEKFSSSLTVDIEHTKKTLNWKPPITLDEGIRRCFK